MYQITLPVQNRVFARNREKTVKQLKRMGVQRVFLAPNRFYWEEEERKTEFALLKENCDYLHQEGFEVGAWAWSFWMEESSFTYMKSLQGKESNKFLCPADSNFLEYASRCIEDVAKTGVDVILFDDDYRFGMLSLQGSCGCENHLRMLSEKMGKTVSLESLYQAMTFGGKNKIRDACYELNGTILKNFAKVMREAVDKVNPNIRVGVCSAPTSWGADGVDSAEISRIMAGNTKPFLRLIGAPYWAVVKSWGNRLQDAIEFERMLRTACGDDIEVHAEGDVYPRPRFQCPASYLEGFDTAIRADGRFDGCFKYAIDLTSNADYETGYIDYHIKNQKLYEEIDQYFANKKAVGLQICHNHKKYTEMEIPKEIEGTDKIDEIVFSPGARMTAACCVPSAYEPTGYGAVAFGADVLGLEETLNGGMIIDAAAALLLQEKGVDVGMGEVRKTFIPECEHFLAWDEYSAIQCLSLEKVIAYDVVCKDGAKVQSTFVCAGKETPASYLYENEKGQRFLVLLFNAYFCSETMFRQYNRSRQLKESIKWLSGKELPAYSYGNPDLYIMAKKSENAMAVGLWNFFADPVFQPVVTLEKEYQDITFINCTGKLEGKQVILSELAPFGFAGFEVQ